MRYTTENLNVAESFRVVLVEPKDLFENDNNDGKEALRLYGVLMEGVNSYKTKMGIPVGCYREVTTKDIKDMFLSQWQIFFVENNAGKIVAMATVKKAAEKDTFKLQNVVVDKDHRGKGLGKMVCEAAIDWCQPNFVQLVVSMANPHAYQLYKSLGFKTTDLEMHLSPKKK